MLMISVSNLGYVKLLNDTDELNNCCAEKNVKSQRTQKSHREEKQNECIILQINIVSVVE